jgi:hypothetical protein
VVEEEEEVEEEEAEPQPNQKHGLDRTPTPVQFGSSAI